jgi:hypothetical protein
MEKKDRALSPHPTPMALGDLRSLMASLGSWATSAQRQRSSKHTRCSIQKVILLTGIALQQLAHDEHVKFVNEDV